MTIKVILVDDHAVVRAGFKMLLSTDARVKVVAEADRGEQAIQLFPVQQPDVMVMDISMPGIGGLEAIRRICARHKGAKILVFSVHEQQVYISKALQAGAKGFISKSSAATVLIEAIVAIAQGQVYIEQKLDKSGRANDSNAQQIDYQSIISCFSPREFDVFLLLAQGHTVHKVADEMCLGYKTVANYSTQLKKKLNISTVAELVHIAVQHGVVNH